ncbi:hypothetical protein PENTCL1PPCAC_20140 [Pristionchus entomophagus]|uniref:Glycine N-acyltransferase-like protein n=1 Tax=Pristionchus entomophagus TaxID=358040 RepID=A0AAV5TUL5_9BILA|nr:hypothetical protein PENTCL1PPCAC_20140 [Pristionchus entomophagus]
MRSYQLLQERNDLIDLHQKLSSRNSEYSLFLNAIIFALLSPPTPTRMFIYLFGDRANPYYVAVHEPNIVIYPPLSGHYLPILHSLLDELFNVILPEIAPNTSRFNVDSDVKTPEMIASSLASYSFDYTGLFRRFYMSDEQERKLREMVITAPAGYCISEIDAEGEYKEIHDAWAYGKIFDRELTREQLLHLPSSCIRSENGSLVSWELSHHFMKMSHHFTYPSERGKGLGVLTELLIAQRYIKLGYRPFKGVSDQNEGVIRGTLASAHWTDGTPYAFSILRRND